MPTLFIASGPEEGHWFLIEQEALVRGRDEGLLAQVVEAGVSRKHMGIHDDKESDSYWAVGLESKNGVFVNNEYMASDMRLKECPL